MIVMTLKRILIYALLLGGLQQCKPQTDTPNSLDGMLLYIEDLDGVGGNASGSFSDIIAFNPASGKQYILTSDNYYDNYPTYSPKTKKIYFESKREKYHPAVGLTAQSHLYELDLFNKRIDIIDNEKFRQQLTLKKWEELNVPQINYSGNKLVFLYYKNRNERMMIYNLAGKNILSYLDSLHYCSRIVFAQNDSNIVYKSQIDTKLTERTEYLATFNIYTKKYIKLLQEENEEYELGDYKFNKLIFTGKIWNQDIKQAKLFIFDIFLKKIKRIASISELGFREIKYPVFKDETSIYFIGSKNSQNPDTFDEDIYLLNIKTKEMKQITFTHNIKDNLRYYE